MITPIRWGILGPGSIANQFAKGLQAAPDGQLVAVGSRDLQRAEAFAEQYDAPNRHGSYEELVADPEVDAIYVATPHPFHKPIDISDNNIPNGNSVMLLNFSRLGMKNEARELSNSLNGFLNIYKSLMTSSLKAIDYHKMTESGKNCTETGCII